MKKSLLVISFLALILVACDQTGLGIGAAFKNLISLPVQGAQKLANSISGKTYEAYKERTVQGVNRDGSSCFQSTPNDVTKPLTFLASRTSESFHATL